MYTEFFTNASIWLLICYDGHLVLSRINVSAYWLLSVYTRSFVNMHVHGCWFISKYTTLLNLLVDLSVCQLELCRSCLIWLWISFAVHCRSSANISTLLLLNLLHYTLVRPRRCLPGCWFVYMSWKSFSACYFVCVVCPDMCTWLLICLYVMEINFCSLIYMNVLCVLISLSASSFFLYEL